MKRLHYIFLTALFLVSCEKSISDFQSKNFIKLFGSGYESKGNDVIELSDGGYLLTGYDLVNNTDYQIFVAKVDESGNLVWSNTYGDSQYKEEGKVVKEVSDGFIIAGTSKDESSGLVRSFIMKINPYGDEVWRRLIGKSTFNISINDVAVESNSIYIVGNSDSLKTNKTDYYISKTDTAGNEDWDRYNSLGTNSSFNKVFIDGDQLLLLGDDGIEDNISVVTNPKNYFSATLQTSIGTGESVVDASYSANQLFLLSYNNSTSTTLLTKLNSDYTEAWHTEAISTIVGKSIALSDDGSSFICGESIVEGNPTINFIKVDKDGNVYFGDKVFKTYQGTVGKVLQTKDKGLILVGTTNSTYGTSVQLIKTDKDYFMLKN